MIFFILSEFFYKILMYLSVYVAFIFEKGIVTSKCGFETRDKEGTRWVDQVWN